MSKEAKSNEQRRSVPANFIEQVESLRKQALARIDDIPIAALIWGPTPDTDSPTAETRRLLRDELARRGHLANFSEDLLDSSSTRSVMAQQVAHAESHDIVFTIPSSHGSIAELHDFARIPWLSHKVVAFLNREWDGGYSHQSLVQIQSTLTCQIQLYDASALPECILNQALDLVARLQELFYVAGRRH